MVDLNFSLSKVSMEFEIVVKRWAVLKCPTSNAGDLFNKVTNPE